MFNPEGDPQSGGIYWGTGEKRAMAHYIFDDTSQAHLTRLAFTAPDTLSMDKNQATKVMSDLCTVLKNETFTADNFVKLLNQKYGTPSAASQYLQPYYVDGSGTTNQRNFQYSDPNTAHHNTQISIQITNFTGGKEAVGIQIMLTNPSKKIYSDTRGPHSLDFPTLVKALGTPAIFSLQSATYNSRPGFMLNLTWGESPSLQQSIFYYSEKGNFKNIIPNSPSYTESD